MLLIFGAIGIGAVMGWSMSNYALSGRNLLFSLLAFTVAAIQIKAISHAASLIPVLVATVAGFGLHFLVLNLLHTRASARP